MTTAERTKSGQFMVPVYFDAHGRRGSAVGEDYIFNFNTYKVVEVCRGEFDGFCWIGVK